MIRFKSITTKFILIGLIMIFFTTAYLFWDYRFTQHIKGEATRINIAGQMRFRNFEMAWLIHKILDTKNPDLRESLIMELKHKMDTFEDIAKNLKEGNRSLDIRPLEYKEGQIMLDNIIDEWHSDFKPMLLKGIELQEKEAGIILDKYNAGIQGYVYRIDKFVSSLEKEYKRKMRKRDISRLYFIGFLAMVSMFILIYVRNLIILPTIRLSDAAKEIAAGNFDARVENKTNDEIGELSKSFNYMTQTLKSLIDGLKERTVELEFARDMAEAATRAKSEFLANISHELRTPLNAIIGFSDVMQIGLGGELTDKQKEYIRTIQKSGDHLLGIINDILDLSAVEAGKMELSYSDVDVNALINESLFFIMEKAMRHGIKVTTDVGENIGTIEADEKRLKQVLVNLLSNAVKFTLDRGSISVSARRVDSSWLMTNIDELSAMSYERNRDFVEISVADTGIGIKPEDTDRLFKPFQQLESPYKKRYEGTGLGLALCKRIVKLHGGDIWAESEYGKGSRFAFKMPVKRRCGQ
jgi:signal transduction histidine kinase